MATDPSALIQQLLSPQAANGFQNSYQAAQNNQLQQQQAQQQIQAGAMQLQQQQQQQQTAQQYQAEANHAVSQPGGITPQDVVRLATKYPQQAKALIDTSKYQDEEAQTANLTHNSNVYNAALNGRADLVQKLLTDRQTALKNAGKPTDTIDDVLKQFTTDPEGALKTAKSLALTQIYANKPDDFAKVFKLEGKDGGGTHVIGQNDTLVNDAGDVLFKGAGGNTKLERVETENADGSKTVRFVPVDQTTGQPVSGGAAAGAPQGRTTGGWTPRQSNGGDNPDAAVDNKIAGVRQFLGVQPGADISSVPVTKIAQALTLSEGGPGSIADRNNNPGNIRNPDGSYKVFPNKQAGLNAAAALVARKLKNGQTTVESLIQGVPVGGSQAQASGSDGGIQTKPAAGFSGSPFGISPDLQGHDVINALPAPIGRQVQALLDGRQQLTARQAVTPLGQQLISAANQADAAFDTTDYNARAKVRNSFTSGADAKNVTSLGTSINHMAELYDSFNKLQNGNIPIFNRIGNTFAKATGNGGPQKAFDANVQAVADELETTFRGSSGTLAGTQSWKEAFDAADSPQAFREVLHKAYSLLQGRADELTDKYSRGIGHQADVTQFLSPVAQRNAALLSTLGPQARGQSDAPASAPPPGGKQVGTYQGKPVYQLPNGKRVVAQ